MLIELNGTELNLVITSLSQIRLFSECQKSSIESGRFVDDGALLKITEKIFNLSQLLNKLKGADANASEKV